MTTLIADCETNGLLDTMTKLHMLQLGDADGTDSVIYADLPQSQVEDVARRKLLRHPIRPLREGLARIAAADRTVWHNGLGFDIWAVNHFHPGTLERHKMLDTLVMARLAEPQQRDHSLEAWGRRTGTLKGDYRGDYQTVDDDFLVYSEGDIDAGRALYHAVKHVRDWGESCDLEHETAYAIRLQETNGFHLDVAAAQELAADLRGQLDAMMDELRATFPPIETEAFIVPKRDNKTRGMKKGVPFRKVKLTPFNPQSRVHCAKALMRLGWKPREENADGTWKMDEAVLKSIAFPQAKVLLRYFKLAKQLGQLSDGKEGWLRHVKPTGRVHGRVNPNGAVTGRMTHSKPNKANIDKDPKMRGLWKPRAGWKLVGCDAEGLEARMLAHYLHRWDKGHYAKVCLEGNSDDRTDVHSANLKALIKAGVLPMVCWKEHFKPSRNGVKTLLYAMMYGGQDNMLGQKTQALLKGLGLPLQPIARPELGANVRRGISSALRGFMELTAAVQAKARTQKWVRGLDGRHIFIRSQHAALNSLLQGGGAIVMKKALCLFMDEMGLNAIAHGEDFGLCANVHDEVQIECRPELAEGIGKAFERCITRAGEHFGLMCPLAGKSAVGASWADTH